MNTSTSSATIEKLRIAFTTHGLPEIVVTDNGSNFASQELKSSSNKMESVTSELRHITLHQMDWLRVPRKHSRRE